MNDGKILIFAGTRPEVIKLAPLVRRIRKIDREKSFFYFTGQHPDLAPKLMNELQIPFDNKTISIEDLKKTRQSLMSLTSRMQDELNDTEFTCGTALGDTNSVLAAAMYCLQRNIPFVHLEAGLRSGSLQEPWPEERNRRIISLIAQKHITFCDRAKSYLEKEGHDEEKIINVESIVLEALAENKFAKTEQNKDVIVTFHRNERIVERTNGIVAVLESIAKFDPSARLIVIKHPNWLDDVEEKMWNGAGTGLKILNPLPHSEFLKMIRSAKMVLTDSGGVHEEAQILGTPIVVFRKFSEPRFREGENDYELISENPKEITEFYQKIQSSPESSRVPILKPKLNPSIIIANELFSYG